MKSKSEYYQDLVLVLEKSSDPKTAEWFTNYLKGVIQYRGLKTGVLKQHLNDFLKQSRLDQTSDKNQLEHIRYWLSQPLAEDKLIAILWLQQWLKPQLKSPQTDLAAAQVLALLEDVFQQGDIYDWSTNDWLCVRVLEWIPEYFPNQIPRLLDWSAATSLWQRRSSLLSFKKSAKNGQHWDCVEVLIQRLLPSKERFIQTAVGWVLSDISKKYPEYTYTLIEKHFNQLSHEVILRHTKYLPQHQALKIRSKNR